MDHHLTLLLLSCLLLVSTTTAVPSSRVFEFAPSAAPIAAPITAASGLQVFGKLLARAAKHFSPEIQNFCTGTENPAMCAETIAPYLTGTFDPVKALEIEINATNEKARQIAVQIKKLLEDPATAKDAMDALGICEAQYEDMLDIMKEVLDLVAQQNVVDAYYKFSGVISDKTSCDDAFDESPGVVNPFAQDGTVLFQLGGNILAILEGIVKNHRI